jgi:uncharacterized damage-inducible protein DinB
MRIAEALLEDYEMEISNTSRTLERVPDDKKDWKPHEKSMPMGRLAMHCAALPLFGFYVLEDDGMDIANSTRPHAPLVFTTQTECLRQLDENAAKCRVALAAKSDESMMAPWPFRFGEQRISNYPRLLTFRAMCFNHLVHHTAQLGVYLRLNNIPVPALYGPSADEQWAPGT